MADAAVAAADDEDAEVLVEVVVVAQGTCHFGSS